MKTFCPAALGEDWCHNSADVTEVPYPPGDKFSFVPTDSFMIRGVSFTSAQVMELQRALVALSKSAVVMNYFAATSIAPASDFASSILSESATRAHLGGKFEQGLQYVPGVKSAIECSQTSTCRGVAQIPTCASKTSLLGLRADKPIKIATPAWLRMAPSQLHELDRYYDTVSSFRKIFVQRAGRSEKDVPEHQHGEGEVGVEALRNGRVDVLLTDAATALLANIQHNMMVVVVEAVDRAKELVGGPTVSGGTKWDPPQLSDPNQRHSAVALVHRHSNVKSFADLQGRRSCHGNFLSAEGLLLPVAYGMATREVQAMLGPEKLQELAKQRGAVDTCTSPLAAVARNIFSASCAPPTADGGAGMCDLCTAGETCGPKHSYATEAGALRGLSEGACEVAFVRQSTYTRICGAAALAPPAWCVPAESLRVVPAQPAVTNENNPAAGFGFVPSHAFIVRKDSLSSAALTSLADTLLTLNLQPTLLSALGLAGVANVTHPQDKSKVLYGDQEATDAHLGILKGVLQQAQLPGFEEFSQCHMANAAPADPADCGAVGTSSFTYSIHSQPSSNGPRTAQAAVGRACDTFRYAERTSWVAASAPGDGVDMTSGSGQRWCLSATQALCTVVLIAVGTVLPTQH